MNHVRSDIDSGVTLEARSLETVIRHLWERARATSELFAQIKEENRGLQERIGQLEGDVVRLKTDLIRKEQENKKLESEHSQLSSSLIGNNIMMEDEREILKTKIRDLISRINSHL